MMTPDLPVLFLKATVKKLITVPGYTKHDGTFVPPHQKMVHYDPDKEVTHVVSGQGSHSQKLAHKKLHASLPGFTDLPVDEQFAHILSSATNVQAAASSAAAVSMWKKAALSGKNPTAKLWQAFYAQPKDKQAALLAAVEKQAGLAHLSAPSAPAHPEKDAALQSAIDHLSEDAKQGDLPASEKAEDAALVEKLKGAKEGAGDPVDPHGMYSSLKPDIDAAISKGDAVDLASIEKYLTLPQNVKDPGAKAALAYLKSKKAEIKPAPVADVPTGSVLKLDSQYQKMNAGEWTVYNQDANLFYLHKVGATVPNASNTVAIPKATLNDAIKVGTAKLKPASLLVDVAKKKSDAKSKLLADLGAAGISVTDHPKGVLLSGNAGGFPKTYANQTQASNAAQKLVDAGFDASVIGLHPYMVVVHGALPKGAAGASDAAGPKEGDTKIEGGVAYVLHGGRWHKQGGGDPASGAKSAGVDFDAHLLPASNTNAGSHNKKIEQIKAAHAKGDASALLAMKFGSNTYGKKQAKLAQQAIADLQGAGGQKPVVFTKPAEAPAVPVFSTAKYQKLAAKVKGYIDAADVEGLQGIVADYNGKGVSGSAKLSAYAKAGLAFLGAAEQAPSAPASGGWKPEPKQPKVMLGGVTYSRQGGGEWVNQSTLKVFKRGPNNWRAVTLDIIGGWPVDTSHMSVEAKELSIDHVAAIHPPEVVEYALDKLWPAGESGPKEGDTKVVNGVTYVLQNGRWHKQGGDEAAQSPAAAEPAPEKRVVFAKPPKESVVIKKLKAIDPAEVQEWLDAPSGKANGDAAFWKLVTKQQATKFHVWMAKSKATPAEYWKPVYRAAALGSLFGMPDQALLNTGEWKPVASVTVYDADKVVLDVTTVKEAAIGAKSGAGAKAHAPKPAAPVSLAAPVSPAAPGAPESIDGWKQTGGQGGYNPGGTFVDGNGEAWYCKFPAGGENVAKNELLAVKLYAAAGVSVPDVKLVTQNGKIGFASKIIKDAKADKAQMLAGSADGLLSGFVADAWLANWDVVGNNPAAGKGFDNILFGKDGKAHRIDAGGALMYGGAGGKKASWGDSVIELETMLDAGKNAHTAAVFGKMSEADRAASAAKVLAVSDEQIKVLVDQYGPGSASAKAKMAATLIARKAYIAGKYPAAAKKAAGAQPSQSVKAKPDPTKLQVDASMLPKPHDFLNWNGSGKPISDKPYVHHNIKDEQAILDFALKGNLVALKDYMFQPVDKMTGQPVGDPKPIAEHSSQYVKQFYDDCVNYLETIANPPEPLRAFSLHDAATVQELADKFKPFDFGKSVGDVPANQRLGFWVALGHALNPHKFVPKETHKPFSKAAIANAKKKFAALPQTVTKFIHAVQGSGSANQPYRDGKAKDSSGQDTRQVVADLYANGTEHDEGITITKWINMPDSMVKQLLSEPEGLVFQNPGSMCTSRSPGATSHFGHHRMTIHFAKGAKGIDTFGSGGFAGEQEITTIPGVRFMVVSRKMIPADNLKGKPRLELEVLMLPPDPTYLANLGRTPNVAKF